MMDESQLQVTPKDGNSSLSLSKVRSGLIGRGLSDVAILAGPSSSATLEQRLADLKPMDMLSECRRLAEEGDADAQWELAIAYYTGDLFEHVLQDNAEAVKWHRKAADAGNAGAQYTLGTEYAVGEVVPQDDAEALRWFLKAAEQGHADAQDRLGFMYAHGHGVPQDCAESVRWCRKAAEQAFADAQYNLGIAYYTGDGVLQDYVQAHMWTNLAASLATGDDQKRYSSARDAVAAKMTPQQIAEAQGLAREWKPKLAR